MKGWVLSLFKRGHDTCLIYLSASLVTNNFKLSISVVFIKDYFRVSTDIQGWKARWLITGASSESSMELKQTCLAPPVEIVMEKFRSGCRHQCFKKLHIYQPTCPSIGDWIHKVCCSHTMESYSAIKRKMLLLRAATWMDLPDIRLSEKSQSSKNRQCRILFIWSLKISKASTWCKKSYWWFLLGGSGINNKGTQGHFLGVMKIFYTLFLVMVYTDAYNFKIWTESLRDMHFIVYNLYLI